MIMSMAEKNKARLCHHTKKKSNTKCLQDAKTCSVSGRNNHSAMLTSCGGMLSDFLNVIPKEFHTAILKKHTTILLESFFPFRLLSSVLLFTYYVHYSFFKLWL